ncbi:hypothetical protein [Rhodovibrio salinarum]|uniref:hypothetical protein n=1 Tax=Rhodovibrio salinarum TaxID=1087 RepID=UPI0012DCC9E6|nr:hypothetical protein [Rhodovibrio salinarum]
MLSFQGAGKEDHAAAGFVPKVRAQITEVTSALRCDACGTLLSFELRVLIPNCAPRCIDGPFEDTVVSAQICPFRLGCRSGFRRGNEIPVVLHTCEPFSVVGLLDAFHYNRMPNAVVQAVR